jgi:hypothetical protein
MQGQEQMRAEVEREVERLSALFGNMGPLEKFGQLKAQAQAAKARGNELYVAHDYAGASRVYSGPIEEIGRLVLLEVVWWQCCHLPYVADVLDLLGQLLNNRAACALKLGDMRRVVADTAASIHLCSLTRLVEE